MTTAYRYGRADGGFSGPVSLPKTMAAASKRIVTGRGPYTITRDGQDIETDVTKPRTLMRLRRLLSGGKLDAVFRVRNAGGVRFSAKRVDVQTEEAATRAEMVRGARWMISHAGSIHYSQARPFHLYSPGALPETLDCSGSTITLARWADAPNPSGTAPGYGNTSTIAAHAKQISRSAIKPGDMVVFGINPTTHVAVVLEVRSDPLMFSHGSESGPVAVALSTEARYHAGQSIRFFSLT